MAENSVLSCPVCCEPYNDNLRLPLTTSCSHTTCAACLRDLTLRAHPDAALGREGTVPPGREVECQVCYKKVSTDQLVIDRGVLAKVPLTLEDLIIPETTNYDPEPLNHDPEPTEHDPEPPNHDPEPLTPQHHEQTTTTTPHHAPPHHTAPQVGWTRPTMDPHHHHDPQHHHDPHQHPQHQPGVIGWATTPQYPHGYPGQHHPPPPQPMPLPPHGHHAQGHHPPGHQSHLPVAAGAAVAGAAVGVAGMSLHHHQKKKKKEKKKKHKKERKHRSSSRSSGSSRSSRSSSRSSKSSDSS